MVREVVEADPVKIRKLCEDVPDRLGIGWTANGRSGSRKVWQTEKKYRRISEYLTVGG